MVSDARHTWIDRTWLLLLALLLAGVALRLGALDWYADMPAATPAGSGLRVPNTFASGDHPFHLAKERAVLDALRDGGLPRWISNHQGGYPSEFYPLGGDVLVAAIYAAGAGRVPLEVCHRLLVIAVLLLPGLAFALIARRGRMPQSVALVATILHLFLPGMWLSGGPEELLVSGLWTNVLASYLSFFVALALVDVVTGWSRRALLVAVALATLAVYTNPRSVFALAAAFVAVGLLTVPDERLTHAGRCSSDAHQGRRVRVTNRRVLWRLAAAAGIVVLLSSPLLLPLRVHQDLYHFERFVEFGSLGEAWSYLSRSVPLVLWPPIALGSVLAWRSGQPQLRVVAAMLVAGLGIVAVAGWLLRDLSMFAQLEGPRLIPMLRLPALFLAALGLHAATRVALVAARASPSALLTGVASVSIALALVGLPVSLVPNDQRGLPEVVTTDQPAFAAIMESLTMFQQVTGPGERPLVAGSPIDVHGSFWVPALSGRSVFHVDWIWYWRELPQSDRTQLADWSSGLDLPFLRRHGLTLVLIDAGFTRMRQLAAEKPYLAPIYSPQAGGFALYRVAPDPRHVGWVSVPSGRVDRVSVARARVEASVRLDVAGPVTVHVNDFPGWQARVNGSAAPIRRSADGYMLVDVPAGDATIVVTYETEPVVWLGRVLAGIGIVASVAVVLAPVPRRRAGRSG
jgi:hypothetical protein